MSTRCHSERFKFKVAIDALSERLTILELCQNTSAKHRDHKVYLYLLRDLTVECPNQVWQEDITYIKVRCGFVYPVALIDVYSRYVVGHTRSISLETE